MRMLKKQGITSSVRVISSHTSWSVPRIWMRNRAWVAEVSEAMAGLGTVLSLPVDPGLDALLDRGHAAGEQRAVTVAPALVDQLERHGVEVQVAHAAELLAEHEPGLLEQPQVLQHPDAAHREVRRHLVDPAARVREHKVEHLPPLAAGERGEHRIHRVGLHG